MVSDDAGNSEQMLRKKLRINWKMLVHNFRDVDTEGTGAVTPAQLRKILARFDMDMGTDNFNEMCRKIDSDGDGAISIQEFKAYFMAGEDGSELKTVQTTPDKALLMIRERIESRLTGGPAGLRRSFAFFDRDGSGHISLDEFKEALKTHTMLQFEEDVLQGLFSLITRGKEEIDFQSFTEAVMGSFKNDRTSMDTRTLRSHKAVSVRAQQLSVLCLSLLSFLCLSLRSHSACCVVFSAGRSPTNAVAFAGPGQRTRRQHRGLHPEEGPDTLEGPAGKTARKGSSQTLPVLSETLPFLELPLPLCQRLRPLRAVLQFAFKHADRAETGSLTPAQLRDCLERFNIDMSDGQFADLCAKIDGDGDGDISYDEFFDFFGYGQADEDPMQSIGVLRNMSSDKALSMIQDKIRERLEGGPAGLRRAFQYFDRDGGGTISRDEFTEALKSHTMLVFSPEIITGIMNKVDPDGSGEINFQQFCEMIMGSKKDDSTSINTHSSAQGRPSNADGNSEQFLIRNVREKWRDLIVAFKHEADEGGNLMPAALRKVLMRHDIILGDAQFEELCLKIDEDGDGDISYSEFMKYFAKGTDADRDVVGVIKGISVGKAKQMIQDKIQGRLEGGPAGLRRAFQFFDRDGGGTISAEEFEYALQKYVGLNFEKSLLASLFAVFDPQGTGEIDFHRFTSLVMDSNMKDSTSMVRERRHQLSLPFLVFPPSFSA